MNNNRIILGSAKMEKREYTVWKFAELSDDLKEKVLEQQCDINIDHEWWECEYEDAANVGIKITAFCIDRGPYCEGNIHDFVKTANKIIAEHGPKCETYITAIAFQDDLEKINTKYPEKWDDTDCYYENENDREDEIEALEEEFKWSILEDYRIILSKQYEYLTSEAAIIETIEANDYDFKADGSID